MIVSNVRRYFTAYNALYTFLTSPGMVSLGTIMDITRGALKFLARFVLGSSSPTKNIGVGDDAPPTCFHICLINGNAQSAAYLKYTTASLLFGICCEDISLYESSPSGRIFIVSTGYSRLNSSIICCASSSSCWLK